MRLRQLKDLPDVLGRYDYTAGLGRDRWAWEFCRRNPEFREIAGFYSAGSDVSARPAPCPGVTLLKLRRPQPDAEARGLCFFPNPEANALAADVFWSNNLYPRDICVQVVEADPGRADTYEALALERCTITHLTGYDGQEQFILRGAGCAVQIRAGGLSLLSGVPHRMVLTIEGDECFETKMEVLKKAHRVFGDESPAGPAWPRPERELRDALVCLDAKEAGLSYWEMAEILHGRDHVDLIRARGSRALKDAVRRKLRRGECLRDGGFRELLLPLTRRSGPAACPHSSSGPAHPAGGASVDA